MSNKVYEKLISKVQNDITSVEEEINSLPDVDFFSLILNRLLSLVLPQFSKFWLNGIRNRDVRIHEIEAKVERIESKIQSGISTYDLAEHTNNKYRLEMNKLLKNTSSLKEKLRSKSIKSIVTKSPVKANSTSINMSKTNKDVLKELNETLKDLKNLEIPEKKNKSDDPEWWE
jgi:hypothetical protein